MRELKLESVPVSDELRAALTSAGLLVDDLDDSGRSFFTFVAADRRVVGYSGIETCSDDAVVLRSVVVLPQYRSQGYGRHLVELTLARTSPPAATYLATTGAASFFELIGFTSVERDQVPPAILSTRQLSGLCPASATIMRLNRPPT
ncbi:GNAT family N-acetyltransferase [Agrobacterium genomosp. 3]|uniref:GNAT family N-acetyltransferase n=1 Tax=Agrobacterium tomkonis TaxID=1183410 RepID=UPI001CD8A5B8|nr:GNAT family N-acetyltransferase [Agrobacterium tomkonis]MCA1878582.1 GNAT family N-acetyltransferase [Agrobacterium tumefaciens]MCA1893807.1 GNAT family N-acetyltransferase [Agrobacterium tomkonis]